MFSTTWAGTPAWVENLQLGIPPPPSSTMWTQGSGLQPRGKKRESGEELDEGGRCWRGFSLLFGGPVVKSGATDVSEFCRVIVYLWRFGHSPCEFELLGSGPAGEMWNFVVYFLEEIRQHLLKTSTAATRMRRQSTYYKVAQFHELSADEDPEIRLWKRVASWAPYQLSKQRVPISPSLVHVYSLSALFLMIFFSFSGLWT